MRETLKAEPQHTAKTSLPKRKGDKLAERNIGSARVGYDREMSIYICLYIHIHLCLSVCLCIYTCLCRLPAKCISVLFIFYSNVATKMAQTLRSYLCFVFFYPVHCSHSLSQGCIMGLKTELLQKQTQRWVKHLGRSFDLSSMRLKRDERVKQS